MIVNISAKAFKLNLVADLIPGKVVGMGSGGRPNMGAPGTPSRP